jgi:hypothetical protein
MQLMREINRSCLQRLQAGDPLLRNGTTFRGSMVVDVDSDPRPDGRGVGFRADQFDRERVLITWPAGNQQLIQKVAADQRLLIVEDQPASC